MSEKKELFDNSLLKCLTQLENYDECKSVEFLAYEGISSGDFLVWESRNAPFKLPDDFKRLYSLFNGFSVSWTCRVNDKDSSVGDIRYLLVFPCNRTHILPSLNKLQDISKIPLDGKFMNCTWKGKAIPIPNPNQCAAYILKSYQIGDIILLLNSTNNISQIWLVDISYRWHYICQNFSDYVRLLVLHLGIVNWQLVFTPEGLTSETIQWMHIFCKERLCVDKFHQASSKG
jgi:tubulin polyglutamylase complex subunit 2